MHVSNYNLDTVICNTIHLLIMSEFLSLLCVCISVPSFRTSNFYSLPLFIVINFKGDILPFSVPILSVYYTRREILASGSPKSKQTAGSRFR